MLPWYERGDTCHNGVTTRERPGHGELAQLGERNAGSVEVKGSNPLFSTITRGRLHNAHILAY
jgi:hypothetical protein